MVAMCRATRGDEVYVCDDALAVLGLVKLIEVRTWDWKAADARLRPQAISLNRV
jgi:hypothetical protein